MNVTSCVPRLGSPCCYRRRACPVRIIAAARSLSRNRWREHGSDAPRRLRRLSRSITLAASLPLHWASATNDRVRRLVARRLWRSSSTPSETSSICLHGEAHRQPFQFATQVMRVLPGSARLATATTPGAGSATAGDQMGEIFGSIVGVRPTDGRGFQRKPERSPARFVERDRAEVFRDARHVDHRRPRLHVRRRRVGARRNRQPSDGAVYFGTGSPISMDPPAITI